MEPYPRFRLAVCYNAPVEKPDEPVGKELWSVAYVVVGTDRAAERLAHLVRAAQRRRLRVRGIRLLIEAVGPIPLHVTARQWLKAALTEASVATIDIRAVDPSAVATMDSHERTGARAVKRRRTRPAA